MAEDKRFEVKHDIPIGSNHYGIVDNATGKKYGKRKYDSQQLCNEINKIVNENEQLKEQLVDANELISIYVDVLKDLGISINEI